MLDVTQVPLSQSALLVVDAQDSFKVEERWERRNNHAFERNVGALVEAHRRAWLPVVYILHTDSDPGFATTHPAFRLMDFLLPRDGEPTFVKNTRNCFTSTPLGPYLMERGVRRVAITGIQMEQCCETTARVAADLGYAVDFVSDATMTFPIPNWDQPGAELGVREIAERTEYALRRRFARIVTTAGLVEELASTVTRRSDRPA
jgi:nicotinamidase-related amidase